MELSNSSLEQLVKEIVAVNHAWKLACDLFDKKQTSPLAISLRDLKTCKQIRLLQTYGITQVYLAIDPEESSEPLYSIRLRHSIGEHGCRAFTCKSCTRNFIASRPKSIDCEQLGECQ